MDHVALPQEGDSVLEGTRRASHLPGLGDHVVSVTKPYNGKNNLTPCDMQSMFPANGRLVKASPCLFFLASCLLCLGHEHHPPAAVRWSYIYTQWPLLCGLFLLGVGVKGGDRPLSEQHLE